MLPANLDTGWGERARDESGTGLLGTTVGFIIFLLFMFLGIHLLLHLYATSLTAGAAYDAATTVASVNAEGNRSGAAATAESDLRSALGGWGNDVSVTWAIDTATVTVTVVGSAPSLLPPGLTDATGLDIDKSVTVRIEEFRDAPP